MSSENAASNTNVVNENDVIEQEQELINFADDQSKFGLALSGGGVRSAAFCLGVIQALHEKGKFKLFDYLSTVSGGGYIGASLIWWLHYFKKEGKNSFPFSVKTADDRKILDYLRTHINYLLPTPRLKLTSFLAVILRMIIVSLFVYISIATTALLALLIVISISFDSFKSLVEFLTSQEEINSIELSVAEFFDYYWYFVPNTYLVFAAVVFLIIDNLIEFFKPLETYRKQKNLFLLKFLARFHKVTQSLVFISPIYFVDINSAVLYLRDRLPNDLSALEKFIANQLLFADLYLLSLFIFGCFAYSILTVIYQFLNKFFESNDWINFRYAKRRESQAIFGKVILISVVLLLLSLIIFGVAAIDKGPQDEYWIILSLFLSLLIFGPAINILFAIFGSATSKTLSTIVPTIGAMTYLSGIAIGVFQFSDYLINSSPSEIIIILFVVIVVLGSSYFVNINFLGIHRMYRDRLMELFLPTLDTVEKNTWKPAESANTTMLDELNGADRPYLLINANLVLVDSENPKFRRRGGDNFIFSKLYCGSSATGWISSKSYPRNHDRFTLATAMAISGAVVNPNTGDKGFTRNRLVSIVMSMLGLRVGYWAPHPNPNISYKRPPNFIRPGIDLVLLNKLKEDSHSIDLTDGGHFENLGLYELIRRKLDCIVVVDSSRDPKYEFSELANVIHLVQVDFGASIRFTDSKFSLQHLRHQTSRSGNFNHKFATNGFAQAKIEYQCGKTGYLLYIKPTLTVDLPVEILSYSATDRNFPYQKTIDQFFDEQQFECYRKLGYHLASDMLNKSIKII